LAHEADFSFYHINLTVISFQSIGLRNALVSPQNTIIDKSAVNNRIFVHESHRWTPPLASNGVMHQMNRSDLMECLELLAAESHFVPAVVKNLDGAAIVHMLDPKKS